MAVFSGLPDDILHSFFNYLSFYDLLRLLAVNTRCRAVGMEHPYYWKSLYLDAKSLPESALEGAKDLFLRRLTHSGDRHVLVSLKMLDPLDLLDEVITHMSHISWLHLTGIDPSIAQYVLFQLDQSAAPVLHELTLRFDGKFKRGLATRSPCLGTRLFRSSAPSLRRLELCNVSLPAEIPTALCALTSFTNVTRGDHVQELPNVLKRCPQLDDLTLGGRFTFCPELLDAPEWRRVRMLLVKPHTTQSGLCPWHAWTRIPLLVATFISLSAATAALSHLSGPLRLVFNIDTTRDRQTRAPVLSFRMSVTTADNPSDDLAARGAHLWRVFSSLLPRASSPRTVQLAGGLFAVAAAAERFVRLTLPLADWDRLAEHIPRLPSLARLRLLVADRPRLLAADGAQFAGHMRPLECPALAGVLLAPDRAGSRAHVSANACGAFVAAVVRCAQFPVEFDCESGVLVLREPPDENFTRVFRRPVRM
ncbi:hypothetical protein AURDEDRAFT_182186 [Auricularia subglabra TFB-10046 SS5]|nr:hypothetical protein AURDEDRAFT_182186 [Auricularia subglabra TFB-10046 SS5]